MTFKQLDALYGEDATRKRIARFRRPAVVFGVVLVGALVATGLTYGKSTVPQYVRLSISIVGMVSLSGFLYSAVILLSPWLLSFADAPKLANDRPRGRRRRRTRS